MSVCAPAATLPTAFGAWEQAQAASLRLARLPFDQMRLQYANAVRAGLVQRSMLASRDFEKSVDALERATLGPWARRV